jgi:hypothetical protein
MGGLALRACAVSAMLALSGCATAPTDIALAPTQGQAAAGTDAAPAAAGEAVLVLAVGPIGMAGQYAVRRVDMQSGAFAAPEVPVTFASWGAGDKMRETRPVDGAAAAPAKPTGAIDVNLLVKKLPAGDYAFTSMFWNTYNGYSSGTASGCFNDRAAVVRLKPGTINVVSSGDVVPPGAMSRLPTSVPPSRILEEFAAARVNYPGLQGEPELAAPVGRIAWQRGVGLLGGAVCEKADRFEVVVGEGAPDMSAQRAAAIEAAKRNLANAPPAPLPPPSPPPTLAAPFQ